MVVVTAEYDLSQPISAILRKATFDARSAGQYNAGLGWLTRGELEKDEYVRFLMMLWHIYDTLERALDKHASHPVLQPIFNPLLLARAPKIATDIAFFLQCQEATWQSHPANTALLLSRPQAFIEYTAHLRAISDSADPSLLLTHAYVLYMGNLNDGQVIRHCVAEAYGIGADRSDGIRFYDFTNFECSKAGMVDDFKRIKQWFRAGMDSGTGGEETLKAALLDEATKAFELNLNLFSILEPPRPPKSPDNSAIFPLGDMESDVDDGESISPVKNNIPVEIIHQDDQPQERMVSLASVFSVVAAVCLAHFLLVTTGFTGTAWIEKVRSIGLLVF